MNKRFNAELFVVVAVRTQGEVNIGVILSGSASLDSAEIVAIASIDFLMAVFTLFICPVFSSSKFLTAAKSTASSKEGRN